MTTITKRTHIGRLRDQNAEQLSHICRLLNWSELGYCRHQFYEYQQMAIELSRGLKNVHPRRLEYSPVFRGFFNNEWELRNREVFLPFAAEWWFDRWSMVEEYKYTHNHMILLADDGFVQRLNQLLNII